MRQATAHGSRTNGPLETKTSGHREAAAWCPSREQNITPQKYGSVETLETLALTLNLLGVALYSGRLLTLANSCRLLVVLTTTHFGKNTGFFAGALETAQGDVERLVVTYFN